MSILQELTALLSPILPVETAFSHVSRLMNIWC